MTEIPEHLLKRAKEARERLEGSDAPAEGSEAASAGAPAEALRASRPPGEGEKNPLRICAGPLALGPPSRPPWPPAAPAAGGASRPAQSAHRPAGTPSDFSPVVKSGSIQDVKAMPQDRVHVWPHLLLGEFVASLLCTAFLLIFSVFVNAPLLELANVNETPNPSKAPWYFLGLQELLTMFHPMVAGVTIPGIALFLLILAPYIDRNKENAPEKRKFAVSLMTVHLMFWAVLVMIGSFFRGPGFNFIFPWNDGLFFDF